MSDAEQTASPRWYHWMGLSACTAAMFALGLVEFLNGADPGSRFFAVDNVVVHVLGVLLALCALWLPLRRPAAFVVSIAVLALHIAENLATYRFEASSLGDSLGVVVSVALLFGLLILTLLELRTVFRGEPGE